MNRLQTKCERALLVIAALFSAGFEQLYAAFPTLGPHPLRLQKEDRCMKMSSKIKWTGLTLMMLSVVSVKASVLVYEGFEYSLANNANMNGAVATGFGLQGNWAVSNVLPSGGEASSLYQTSGLSFGSGFATTAGGSVLLKTKFSGTDAKTTATVQLDATATGTVWCGFLVNYTSMSLSGSGSSTEGIATNAAATGVILKSTITSDAAASSRKLGVSYDNKYVWPDSYQAASFATSTTYLYLSKYTNVGLPLSGSQTGVATTWVMTQAQFESWVAAGATEATLGSYDTVAKSDTVTSGTYAFDQTGFVFLQADPPNFNGKVLYAQYDEIRYGTKLKDVYNPDPLGTQIIVR